MKPRIAILEIAETWEREHIARALGGSEPVWFAEPLSLENEVVRIDHGCRS